MTHGNDPQPRSASQPARNGGSRAVADLHPPLGMTSRCPACQQFRVAGHNGFGCITASCPKHYRKEGEGNG